MNARANKDKVKLKKSQRQFRKHEKAKVMKLNQHLHLDEVGDV